MGSDGISINEAMSKWFITKEQAEQLDKTMVDYVNRSQGTWNHAEI